MHALKRFTRITILAGAALLLAAAAFDGKAAAAERPATTAMANTTEVVMNPIPSNEEDWKKVLTPEEYRVLRQKGTEAPYTGKYYRHDEAGNYYCAGCGTLLFSSKTKFDAGCGWPSFYEAKEKGNIEERTDTSHQMVRTEVLCKKCGGHLGHVFEDGPQPTGLRYCINSVSIRFQKEP